MIVAALVVQLAGPAMVQVGQFGDGSPVAEPYPSVLFIRVAIGLFSLAMLAYDIAMTFVR